MVLKRKNPCKECPFRKESARGWLGPWTIDTILLQVHSDLNPLPGLACHLDVSAKKDLGLHGTELYDKSHVCVGSLQHANKSAKRYRNFILNKMAEAVGVSDQILDLFGFKKHHGGE
jgi:hypothetical protein